jgi:hypothetical protein
MLIDPDGKSSAELWKSPNPTNFIELRELGRSHHPATPTDRAALHPASIQRPKIAA